VVVADLNVNNVEWIEEHFPPSAKGLKVSSLPGVPLGDVSVDLCYAFSVFTHIDVYETSWIAEIARILRRGGRAYLTIHSEHTWSLLPDIHLFNSLKDNDSFRQLFSTGGPMPGERLVFDYDPDSNDYNCNVFHHSDYIRRRWHKWLNITSVIPGGHGYQTVIVCEKT
jgi:SAM-dependent methyltransferase